MNDEVLIFDLESDHLLEKVTNVHCLVITTENGAVRRYNDQDGEHAGFERVVDGVRRLARAKEVIGHNVIGFDIPVLKKLYPKETEDFRAKITDTIVLSRLMYSDLKDTDFRKFSNKPEFPKHLIGSHGLKAWGYRIGELKGTFKEDNDFEKWTVAMENYCEQDTKVTLKLWKHFMSKNYSDKAIQLEHQFAYIMFLQEQRGFALDVDKAHKLYAQLSQRRLEIEAGLQKIFPPRKMMLKSTFFNFADKVFLSKTEAVDFVKDLVAREKALGSKVTLAQMSKRITKGDAKSKEIPFNPGSRDQAVSRLQEKGWKPTVFTGSGKPKMDETVLKRIVFPEAKALLEYYLIVKRLGQLGEGKEALLKLERSGRIHGRVNANGAVTGRCTHSKPNMAQLPRVGSLYGKEFRELMVASFGYKLVGCDASGLELRCLAHFMAKYDKGAYAKVILEGDVHTTNQEAAGLPNRDMAKTFIYALLYGAGDEKIGKIIGKGSMAGRQLKGKFFQRLPALKRLKDDIEKAVQKRGYLFGIDGRRLTVRSSHAALNTVLQSAGALIVKKATCLLFEKLQSSVFGDDIKWGAQWAMVAHIHDEFQNEVLDVPDLLKLVGDTAVKSFKEAGEYFNFRCPITGTYKIGNNWAETH